MNSSTEAILSSDASEFQQNLELLRQISFFSGLSMEPLKVLAYLATRERLKSGEILFKAGEQESQAVYVLSGRLDAASAEGVARAAYHPGDFLGLLALVGRSPILYTVTAAEETLFLAITRERFYKTLEQFPEIAGKTLTAVSDAVHAWDRKALDRASEHDGGARAIAGVSLL